MAQDIIVSIPATHLFLPLVSIVLLAAAIIIGLDCVWRTHHRLDTFMKLLTAALIIQVVEEILAIFIPASEVVLIGFNILASLLFLLSLIEMYKIIRTWDNEAPPKV